jgi:hypothetical protein
VLHWEGIKSIQWVYLCVRKLDFTKTILHIVATVPHLSSSLDFLSSMTSRLRHILIWTQDFWNGGNLSWAEFI